MNEAPSLEATVDVLSKNMPLAMLFRDHMYHMLCFSSSPFYVGVLSHHGLLLGEIMSPESPST